MKHIKLNECSGNVKIHRKIIQDNLRVNELRIYSDSDPDG